MFKEEDAFDLISLFYSLSLLFHGPYTTLYFENPSLMGHVCEDFTKAFINHYFS